MGHSVIEKLFFSMGARSWTFVSVEKILKHKSSKGSFNTPSQTCANNGFEKFVQNIRRIKKPEKTPHVT